MPVACEFIDIVVPIDRIDEKYPGGFAAFKRENAQMFGGRLWHDRFLLRDGAMSPADAQYAVQSWEKFGLIGQTSINGQLHWGDVCVVESMFGGPTLPCAWIRYDPERRCVSHMDDHDNIIIDRACFLPEV